MKRKILYLLVLICSLGAISSAKQSGYNCATKSRCNTEMKSRGETLTLKKNEAVFELLPFRLLVFDF